VEEHDGGSEGSLQGGRKEAEGRVPEADGAMEVYKQKKLEVCKTILQYFYGSY
jgi:hypothetical protein